MRDIYLDSSHDIAFDEQGRLLVVDGISAIAQAVKVAISTGKGELPFDYDYGVDITQSQEAIRADILDAVTQIEGVTSVENIGLSLSGRVLTITVSATTTLGSIEVTA